MPFKVQICANNQIQCHFLLDIYTVMIWWQWPKDIFLKCGRVVKLRKPTLMQQSIGADVDRFFFFFLNSTEGYSKRSSGTLHKFHQHWTREPDSSPSHWRSLTQIKFISLSETEEFKQQTASSKASSPWAPQNWDSVDFARDMNL